MDSKFWEASDFQTFTTDELGRYAPRLAGKVVVITGGASGIGRETSLLFARFGAKVVIGDFNENGAEETASAIRGAGGVAESVKCNVTTWEDQVRLFKLAFDHFGCVDIVIPNAGVSETGNFETVELVDGQPTKPDLRPIEINLVGALYTARLAIHYLHLNRKPDELKALIFIGSMASWQSLPTAPTYSASKHGVLGAMRSLHHSFEQQGVRIGSVHPFFVRTPLVPPAVRLFLAGIPLAKIEQVAKTVLYAATDQNSNTSGASWFIIDDGPTVAVTKEQFRLGVYKMLDERRLGLLRRVGAARHYARILVDVGTVIITNRVLALISILLLTIVLYIGHGNI